MMIQVQKEILSICCLTMKFEAKQKFSLLTTSLPSNVAWYLSRCYLFNKGSQFKQIVIYHHRKSYLTYHDLPSIIDDLPSMTYHQWVTVDHLPLMTYNRWFAMDDLPSMILKYLDCAIINLWDYHFVSIAGINQATSYKKFNITGGKGVHTETYRQEVLWGI